MEMFRKRVERLPSDAFVYFYEVVAEFGERTAVDLALHRRKEIETLLPVRRGLCYKGRQTRFGISRPDPLRTGYEVAEAVGFAFGVEQSGHTAERLDWILRSRSGTS